ncbi:M48 family metallopeptidase [Heliobacterium mobile]|nr:SprT family zinc-dependent metalloprotease [Heliobacterium mobile]
MPVRELFIHQNKVPVTVEKSKRLRSVSMRISPQGLLVRGPTSLTEEEIQQFIREKERWISRHWTRFSLEGQRRAKAIEEKRLFFYGKPYRLVLSLEEKPIPLRERVHFSGNQLVLHIEQSKEKDWQKELREWFLFQAKVVIGKRLAEIAQHLRCQYGTVTIRDQKTRWGSCSSRKNLSFNWRLVAMPPKVLDYVIIHELCHLKEMNHSSKFWSAVGQIIPDYMVHRQWLKEHGKEMTYILDEDFLPGQQGENPLPSKRGSGKGKRNG